MMSSGSGCATRAPPAAEDLAPGVQADRVREEDLIVDRTEKLLSAAIAALVFTSPLTAQQVPVTAVTLEQAIKLSEQTQPSIISAQGTVSVDEATVRARRGAFLPSLSVSSAGSRSFSQGPSRSDPNTGQIINGNR